jgi:transposase
MIRCDAIWLCTQTTDMRYIQKLTFELSVLRRRSFSKKHEHFTAEQGCLLNYHPGTFSVQRHIRGKWACKHCQTLTQAPVPAHIIDKGIPTTSLLAQVLVNKYRDHLPLYRQEQIFAYCGYAIPRSTLAQWVGQYGATLQALVQALRAILLSESVLHADETPLKMLGTH